MSQSATTYLEIIVGRYRLALRTDCVLGVLTEVTGAAHVSFRGVDLPFVDLATLFGGPERSAAPFGVAFEHNGAGVVVGVDAVDHVRPGASPRLVAMPGFGLGRPDLFQGVLRDGDKCMLVLVPAVLAELTAAKSNAI